MAKLDFRSRLFEGARRLMERTVSLGDRYEAACDRPSQEQLALAAAGS